MFDQHVRYRGILVFGYPGAGKGTVSSFLCKEFNHIHLSTGEIIRGRLRDFPEDPISKECKALVEKGNLISDDLVVSLWHSHLQELIKEKKYDPKSQFLFLDGIPRTWQQAEILTSYLNLEHIIVLDAQVSGLIERLKKRAEIEGRKDDADESVLHNRMRVYEAETKPILDYYQNKSKSTKIHHINGDQTREQVIQDILVDLKEVLSS